MTGWSNEISSPAYLKAFTVSLWLAVWIICWAMQLKWLGLNDFCQLLVVKFWWMDVWYFRGDVVRWWRQAILMLLEPVEEGWDSDDDNDEGHGYDTDFSKDANDEEGSEDDENECIRGVPHLGHLISAMIHVWIEARIMILFSYHFKVYTSRIENVLKVCLSPVPVNYISTTLGSQLTSMENRQDPSHKKPDRGKWVSKKTPKVTAAAEAKKGGKVARGGKKGSKSQAGGKQKARGHSIVEYSGEESESEWERWWKTEDCVCTFMLYLTASMHSCQASWDDQWTWALIAATQWSSRACSHLLGQMSWQPKVVSEKLTITGHFAKSSSPSTRNMSRHLML
jgi:hypothetical protein